MFNRNNLPSVPNPFGARADQSPRPQQRDPYSSQNAAPRGKADYDTPMTGGYDSRLGYGTPPSYPNGPLSTQNMPSRSSRGSGGGGRQWHLTPEKSPDNSFTFRNLVAVSPQDFPPSREGGEDRLLLLQGQFVVSARPYHLLRPGLIGLSSEQRTWMGLAMTDTVVAELYDPFSQGDQAYLGSMDVEIGFAGTKKREERPYDQDELAKVVTQVCHLPERC
jgi:vesicle-fusing ATPase